jgi:hypothetical protein
MPDNTTLPPDSTRADVQRATTEEVKKQIARSMKVEGLPVDIISKTTQLTAEEIEKL